VAGRADVQHQHRRGLDRRHARLISRAGAQLNISRAASSSWVGYLRALTACGFTRGLAYAFTTVATQAVVRPERGGRGRGRDADCVGHFCRCRSGTVPEMLQRAGMSPAGAIDAVVAVLAALLLPAGVVVLFIARASNPGAEI
jgi:hypothetical protein